MYRRYDQGIILVFFIELSCMGGGEVHMGLWWKDIKERDHLKDPDVDGSLI